MGRYAFSLARADAIHVVRNMRSNDRIEACATSGLLSDDERGAKLAAGLGIVFTVWSAGGPIEPIAIGGWLPIWPGVASAWMLATERIGEVGITLDRAAIDGHRRMFDDGYHRLQAFGLAERAESRAWLINLGYIPEGTHPRFGRYGETFASYGKLRKDDA